MAARDPERRREVARLGAYCKHQTGSAEAADLHRKIKAEALERYIKAAVDAAPPLSDEQRHRLAALLRPGAA